MYCYLIVEVSNCTFIKFFCFLSNKKHYIPFFCSFSFILLLWEKIMGRRGSYSRCLVINWTCENSKWTPPPIWSLLPHNFSFKSCLFTLVSIFQSQCLVAGYKTLFIVFGDWLPNTLYSIWWSSTEICKLTKRVFNRQPSNAMNSWPLNTLKSVR